MLLASLNPSAVAAGADIPDAVTIDGTTLSRSDLVGAATSVAERVAGAARVAVLATHTPMTVLAVTGCLIAGVPFVPVPADVGIAERHHILTDSGAQAWLGELPRGHRGIAAHPGAAPCPVLAPLRRAAARRARATFCTPPAPPVRPRACRPVARAIAADIDALAAAWQWTADDTLVHGLPLFHVHGLVLGLLGSLRIGNRFVHTGKPTPQAYAEAAARWAEPCTSGCRRCGPGSPQISMPRWRCRRPGCWFRAARRCRCRCSSGWPSSPDTRPSSATAVPNR